MGRHMGADTKCKILILRERKKGPSSIGKAVGRKKQTVNNFLDRFDERETLQNKHSSNKQKALDKRTIRRLVRLALTNRRLSAAKLGQLAGTNASASTIRRELNANGIKSRRPLKKPKLNEKQKKARLMWALEHRN